MQEEASWLCGKGGQTEEAGGAAAGVCSEAAGSGDAIQTIGCDFSGVDDDDADACGRCDSVAQEAQKAGLMFINVHDFNPEQNSG